MENTRERHVRVYIMRHNILILLLYSQYTHYNKMLFSVVSMRPDGSSIGKLLKYNTTAGNKQRKK